MTTDPYEPPDAGDEDEQYAVPTELLDIYVACEQAGITPEKFAELFPPDPADYEPHR